MSEQRFTPAWYDLKFNVCVLYQYMTFVSEYHISALDVADARLMSRNIVCVFEC